MNLEEIKKFLEENKDNADVKSFVSGFVTVDAVSSYLESKEGKKLMQPKLDQHFTKSLETWKANNLEELIEAEVNKRNPQKTEEQKRIEKLEKQLEQEKKDRQREALRNKALSVASEKGLPSEVIDHFLGDDEDVTLENIGKLETAFNTYVDKRVEEKFKANGRHPEGGIPGAASSNVQSLAELAAQNSIR
ncbi:DUF4355 domain-containing protein [Aneurinibacillus aneurinilyticus]|uniref:DUF4355 domain-containing protein n=1 Tax=Aneurinibacillus aneurinilyticus ATCC 12856 TaxID=649747 RepID=U1Y2P6_ANEAE|nr:DUF4355 domain-containing protein [Aneurinibacillus aneurinilyticus]ERI06472.1 hypothetical protein HMPREF0083_05314 [Aneurinibacillus aneurinilyticus ATCC 12856]MED0670635.1 DUF4355 domain-containing protein [Aneurinibacillus aneurinilyticus]MED0707087.1 DUF4355 domain-containing protein [Aneurinibacillus aneurinilyticus]MED0732844.1 DUF4355 domain-containing protein [Aneurinibacillus aneurinilyticus]MED0740386.1 DUF4355 domain-containing protein [Aneurinibacillus aneurinilyticus]